MISFDLHNNGTSIGAVKANEKAIQKIGRDFWMPLGVLFIAATLSTGPKTSVEEPVEEPVIEMPLEKDAVELPNVGIYEEEEPIDGKYKVVDEQTGEVKYYTLEEVNHMNYKILDTIDTKYEFIVSFNDSLINGLRDEHKEVDFTEYDTKYQFFRSVYEEYIDGGQISLAHKEYITFLEEDLIKTIEATKLAEYHLEAVPFEKYFDIMFPQPEPYQKLTIEYQIPEGATLSGIIDSYADTQDEFKTIFHDVVTINNIENPDEITAGATLILPRVDYNDLVDVFGYNLEANHALNKYVTEKDEFEQRYKWINDKVKDIQMLQGDIEAEEKKAYLDEEVKKLNQAYKEYYMGEREFDPIFNKMKNICSTIEYLSGEHFKVILPTAQEINSRNNESEYITVKADEDESDVKTKLL